MLQRNDLLSLERYAEQRNQFRQRVMAHKAQRQVMLGDHIRLLFEDRTTIQYQIQEMLRVERIFEPDAIQEELDTYNPLIPDGSNWKATMMIEYTDVDARREALAGLIGVEDRVWVQVEGCAPVYARADEDLARENAEKTSSVHFLAFGLEAGMVTALKGGAALWMGVDHSACQHRVAVPETVRQALLEDLN